MVRGVLNLKLWISLILGGLVWRINSLLIYIFHFGGCGDLPDDVPCNLVVRLGSCFDRVSCQVIEGANIPQHTNLLRKVNQIPHKKTNRLVERTVSIIRTVAILLQEIIFQQLGNLLDRPLKGRICIFLSMT